MNTATRRRRLIERDGGACWWCSVSFTDELPPTIDHLIPRRAGGSNEDDNLVLACGPCNSRRGHTETCAACGGRVRQRSWPTAVWVDRRLLYHGHCHRVLTRSQIA